MKLIELKKINLSFNFSHFFTSLFFLIYCFSVSLYSQYFIEIINPKTITDKILEFDIIIKNNGNDFILTSYQCALSCNTASINGGNLSFNYIPNSSELVNYPANSIGVLMEGGLQKLCFASKAGYNSYDIIKNNYQKIGTFRVQNSNSFNYNSLNIQWIFSNHILTLLTDQYYMDITYPNNFYNLDTPPVISIIPDFNFNEDDSLKINKSYFYTFINDNIQPDSLLGYNFSSGKFIEAKWINGILTLTANQNWNGTDSIKIKVSDGLNEATAVILVKVNSINDPPVLTKVGNQRTLKNTMKNMKVMFLDADLTDSHIIVVTSDNPSVVVTNLSGNSSGSTYDLIPAANWIGTTNINVSVIDNGVGNLSNTEIYTLTVENLNSPPIISNIPAISFSEDDSLKINKIFFQPYVTDSDNAENTLIYSFESGNFVNVKWDNFTLTLKANTNWNGNDLIRIKVNDGIYETISEISVNVISINDPPIIKKIGNQRTLKNETEHLTLEYNDADPNDAHTITIESNNQNIIIANLSGNVSGSTYDLIPATNWIGSTNIKVTVIDNGINNLTDSETYTLVVDNFNAAPAISKIPTISLIEDDSLKINRIYFKPYVIDNDNSDSTLIYSFESGKFVKAKWINSILTLSVAANWNGTDSVKIKVSDGIYETKSGIKVIVNSVNDRPIIVKVGNQKTQKNVTRNVIVTYTDADSSDSHIITVVSDNPNVQVANLCGSISGSRYDLIPFKDWYGTANITVTVKDNGINNLTDSETYSLTVKNGNNQLEISQIPDIKFNEDDSIKIELDYFKSFVSNDNISDSILVFSFESGKFVNVKWTNSILILNASANKNWIDSIKIKVSNGKSEAVASILIFVIPVNDPPYFLFRDTLKIKPNLPTNFNLWTITNDAETPSQYLTYEFSFDNSILSGNFDRSNGNLIITPHNAQLGYYKLNLSAKDGENAVGYNTIIINVTNSITSVEENIIPSDYILYQNYPNPFNASTIIKYGIPVTSQVRIVVYNMVGQIVNELVDETKNEGIYEQYFNAENLSSGIYFLTYNFISVDYSRKFNHTMKILLLK